MAIQRIRVRLKSLILVAPLLLALVPSTSTAAPPNLYEWMAIAPVVVAGENLGTYGKYAEFKVQNVYRGKVASNEIKVNVRRANRDRDRLVYKEALRFEERTSYVLLLVPIAPRKPDGQATFELIRGVRGAREVPLEGSGPFLDAVERFVLLQDQRDDRVVWRQLAQMIEDTNPLLIRTALDQFLKFRRGDPQLLDSLRPLLDHPTPELRERTARLIGQVLMRNGEDPIPDVGTLQNELVARARRDDAILVRVAAVQALDQLGSDTVQEILEDIARDDPDQTVRYAAEKLMYDHQEREQRRSSKDDGTAALGRRAGSGTAN
jgi:HEAT repeat protein